MPLRVRKIILSVVCVGLLSLVCLPLGAQDDSLPKINIQTNKYTLENGLTVLVSEIPSSSAVSVYGLVKTGSATEGKFLGTGLSHFLEHMLFKGTAKRKVGQISKEIQAMGGEVNASTSFDYTIYTITVPKSGFDQAVDILADMLMNSKFDPKEIEKEREVVYGEMRLYKDRPENRLNEILNRTVYIQHPYQFPIIGYEELLRDLKNEDFVEYYKTHYTPNNTIISVAGNVEPNAALEKVKEEFRDFRRQRPVLRNLTSEPQQVSPRRYEEDYSTDLTRVTLAYQGMSLLNPDMFPMDILAMVLGHGESSRLYKELFKKQGLVRSISASNFTPIDRGTFEIDFIPADNAAVDSVIAAIKDQIRLIQEHGINPSELEKIKRQVISSYVHEQQTSSSIAYSRAVDEAFAGDYAFAKKYVTSIGAVTADQVKRAANSYLQDSSLSVVVLNASKTKKEAAPKAAALSDLPIEKITLDNGLVVLLKENPALPIVTVNLVLNGGTGQEPVNGLFELTARTWTEGTKTKTAEDIAQTVESHGASVSGFSGRNSFGLRMSFLSEDLNWALDLLEDLVKNPSFAEAEFVKQKERVRTSIISRQDDITSVTFKALREELFKTHPLRLEPLGTLESIEPIKAQDAAQLYRQFASPSNMVLSIFGNFNKQEAQDLLNRKFSDLTSAKVTLKTVEELPPDKLREKTISLKKEQAMVAIGFQAPGFYSKDRFGLEVLSSILGSSFSGRLFNRIRDEFGQAYTLGGSYTPGRDMGLMSFYVLTNKESVGKVRDLLKELIREIREKPVGEAELKDMKMYLKGSFALGTETNSELSFISSLDELYGLGYNHYRSYDQMIDQVTKEDIQRLAKMYLDLNKAALVIAQPSDEPREEP